MSNSLHEQWIQLTSLFSDDLSLAEDLFNEIHSAYSKSSRHYHGVSHIQSLLNFSNQYSEELTNKYIVDFAIFYHDIVYKSAKSDNEEQSAVLAQKRLAQIKVPVEKIDVIIEFIRATKSHVIVQSPYAKDLAWFLDFDLSVLGADEETYFSYAKNIRKEFRIYPDLLYKPGRKKALQHFLEKEHIYQTDEFKKRFEQQARKNLIKELESL
jgi:predicted metal-dependent HD superfamily phosphohydrolase